MYESETIRPFIDTRGRAVVSYFGLPEISKKPQCRRSCSTPEDDVTRTHSCVKYTMLNPHYTAPEAWEPLKKSSLNIFGIRKMEFLQSLMPRVFGCTLVEMCAGAIPWNNPSPEEIYRPVVKARGQPPEYASVVGVGIPRDL